MTLPLPPIGLWFVFLASILGARLIATQLPASIAESAVVGFVFALWYLGPLLCGKDWFEVCFLLGVCIGGFGHLAHTRKMANEDNEQKTTEPWWRGFPLSLVIVLVLLIVLVIRIATGR
jgi:uncharacterized membrane protein